MMIEINGVLLNTDHVIDMDFNATKDGKTCAKVCLDDGRKWFFWGDIAVLNEYKEGIMLQQERNSANTKLLRSIAQILNQKTGPRCNADRKILDKIWSTIK